ncbi:nucleotidyltransferase domain-containing protein [Candidatus Woesearchaeota archaeon]|nr:MAG: nucleotidyltransferase domain-containing protein [Candidatus Woesearchaeota archaeon]
MSLEHHLREASAYVSSQFNIDIVQSRLKFYSGERWHRFCNINGFHQSSTGVYIPQAYKAYVREDTPVMLSTLYHEYYGHGLFCEHSEIGRPLYSMSKKEGELYLYKTIDNQVQQLGLASKNVYNYEGFAVWLESLLCRVTGNENVWQQKLTTLNRNILELYHYFRYAESRLTTFGFMSQLGFPKHYDKEKLISTLRHLYSDKFFNIDLVILYGSQKPKSDIDLFIVSSNPSTNFFNGWLDIYELNREEFRHLLSNLDISATDPLFSGRLIYGDTNYFQQAKQQVLHATITPESIQHNRQRSEEQASLLNSLKSKRDLKVCTSYIYSYQKNAQHLEQGTKLLTLNNLLNHPHHLFF